MSHSITFGRQQLKLGKMRLGDAYILAKEIYQEDAEKIMNLRG